MAPKTVVPAVEQASLEAKVDQVLADNKRLIQEVSELRDWVKRMVRVAKAH